VTVETVGLVGVGLVGIELARHLLRSGHDVLGFDIDPARLASLREAGGRAAGSAADVGASAARIFLALIDTPTTVAAVEGAGGVLEGGAARLLIDTSTGDPDAVVALGDRLAPRGIALVDATLSGSSAQIGSREAVMMVGADDADYRACADLLETVAGRIYRVGGRGAGTKAKLASNVVVGLNRAALAEGLVFAEALGLDLDAFLALLKGSPAYSKAMDAKGERMLRGRFEPPESRVRQHLKDVNIVLDYARAARQPLPLCEAHHALLESLVAAGDGELDNAAVIRAVRNAGKVRVP